MRSPIAGAFGEVDSSATGPRADHLSAWSPSTGAPITSFLRKSRTNTSPTHTHNSQSAGQRVKCGSNLFLIFRYYPLFYGNPIFFSYHQGLKMVLCYICQCCSLHLLFRSHLSKLTHKSSCTPVLIFPFSSHRGLKVSRA